MNQQEEIKVWVSKMEGLVNNLVNLANKTAEFCPDVAAILFVIAGSIHSEHDLSHLTQLNQLVCEFAQKAKQEISDHQKQKGKYDG